MKKTYKMFSTFDSAKDFAKSHAPSLIKRHDDYVGWLVVYERPEETHVKQVSINKRDYIQDLKGTASDVKSDVQHDDYGQGYYESALEMQKKCIEIPILNSRMLLKNT